MPWSREPATNHLLSAVETRAAIEAAGLVIEVCNDDTDTALSWFSQLAAAGPPPGLNLGRSWAKSSALSPATSAGTCAKGARAS